MNQRGAVTLQTRLIIFLTSVFMILVMNRSKVINENIKTAVVKDNFRVFSIGSEFVFREHVSNHGKKELYKSVDDLNSYLDTSNKVTVVEETNNTIYGITTSLDPWKELYRAELTNKTIKGSEVPTIYFKSFGKSYAGRSTRINSNTVQPDFVIVTQIYDGIIRTCTAGFSENMNELMGNMSSGLVVDSSDKIIDYKQLNCFK